MTDICIMTCHMYTGAASITHGCSLYHIRLQGHASHGVLVEAGGGGRLSANRICANGGAPLRHRRSPPPLTLPPLKAPDVDMVLCESK